MLKLYTAPLSYVLSPVTSDLLVCTGFTPDVKLWEVEYSKAGEFQQVLTCRLVDTQKLVLLVLCQTQSTQKG